MTDHPYTIDGYAEQVTVTGWKCAKCGRFYGNGGGAERSASYCCSEHAECDKCGEPARKPWLRCDRCRETDEHERHEARERAPWDGICMVYSDAADRYFCDPYEAMEYLQDDGYESVESMRLLLCVPDNGREFDIGEFQADHLPDEDHGDPEPRWSREEADRINGIVNGFVAEYAPLCWRPGEVAWNGES